MLLILHEVMSEKPKANKKIVVLEKPREG